MTSLFGHSVRPELLVLYATEAFLSFGAAYLLLSGLPAGGGIVEPRLSLVLALGLALSAGLLAGASGLYHPQAWLRLRRLLAGTAVAVLLLVLLGQPVLTLLGAGWSDASHRGALVEILLAFSLAILATRLGFAVAARQGLLERRLAVVRAAGVAPTLFEGDAAGRDDPFEIALTVPAEAALDEALSPRRLRERRIWAVILPDGRALPQAVLRQVRGAGVRVFAATEFRELHLTRVDVERLPEHWLATARGGQDRPLQAAAHRALDLVVSILLLLLTLPLMLAVAAAVKLDSPGPVFYRQERVGRGGRVFTLFKFRSMVVDAEAGGAPRWASKGDSRVTRVGRFIRLTRIDEIPQFLNVLRGDMAIVGPRPERPAFVATLGEAIPHYHDRACVKPGITGWAQVNYPYGASIEDSRMKLAYDLYYIRRRSLFLDLLILVATVRVVLFQEGAR